MTVTAVFLQLQIWFKEQRKLSRKLVFYSLLVGWLLSLVSKLSLESSLISCTQRACRQPSPGLKRQTTRLRKRIYWNPQQMLQFWNQRNMNTCMKHVAVN